MLCNDPNIQDHWKDNIFSGSNTTDKHLSTAQPARANIFFFNQLSPHLIWLHAIGNIKRFWRTNVTFTSKISWWASSIILSSVSVWRPPFTRITSVTWSAPASPPIRRFTLSILWISPSRRRTVPLYGLTASGFLFRWTSLFLALLQWARARPNWWSFQISTPFLTGTFPWWWTLFLFFTLNTSFVLFLQGDICNLQEK